MPIERCGLPGGKQGYRWGQSGVCYAERDDAQRQAAAAYAHGYQGDGATSAAGVLLHRDGELFLTQRADDGTWAFLGGMMEPGEDALSAAAREFQEESGVAIDAASLVPLHTHIRDDGRADFVAFLDPSWQGPALTLCDEHTSSGWFPIANLPAPLHPGVREAIDAIKQAVPMANDALAMDRMTVRSLDNFGRMHVEMANISKANVCPYYGREIPNYEAKGLEPNRTYMLLRDPVELAKGAPTFARLPVLQKHIRHSSDAPVKWAVVGTTGSDPAFTPPYLQSDLAIWDDAAIAGVETGEQKELSSSYSYNVDMTPGVFEGVPYDGRMIDIVGNHVALVSVGRAGADVVVGDSYPVELLPMKKVNRSALAMRSALGAHLRPALAQDEAPLDLRQLVTPGAKPADVAKATKKHFQGKFEVNEAELTSVLTVAMDEAAKEAEDEDKDDDEDDEKKDKDKSKKEKDGPVSKDKNPEPAMDAATVEQMVNRARDEATRQAREEGRALREAQAAVRPLVGELAMDSADSAETVYRTTLEACGVENVKDIHASALPSMIDLIKKNRAAPPRADVAMDSATRRDSLHTLIPNAKHVPKRA